MGVEIERKFLVASEAWRDLPSTAQRLQQGYLAFASEDASEVRVRLISPESGDEGASAKLTVKSSGGLVRSETEVDISVDACQDFLKQCSASLKKTRYTLPWEGLAIEVDVYEGKLAGLVVAEIELPNIDHVVRLPDWLGEEVTERKEFKNAKLAQADAPPGSEPVRSKPKM